MKPHATLYRWRDNQMEIFSRDDANELVVKLTGVPMGMSHEISKALDRIYADGLRDGKLSVINAVNHATDAITV